MEYYFPSCKVSAQFKDSSRQAREYIRKRFGIGPVGCCRPNHKKLAAGDTAIVVCNNCAAIIEENTEAEIRFLWQIIDDDPDFPFPDYHGEEMTVQDCWIAFEKRPVQDAVRSLMRKMNIRAAELEDNFEKTTFCGVNLLSPCTESNAKLAHKRYVEQYLHMFTPMSPEEQEAHFRSHCERISTEKAVCYCKFYTDAVNMGGKQGIHLLELLFPAGTDCETKGEETS